LIAPFGGIAIPVQSLGMPPVAPAAGRGVGAGDGRTVGGRGAAKKDAQ
jgi:hypothetical protein